MKIILSTGIGTGPTKLAAFDAALCAAGVSNFNLIRLSSVIPPHSEITERLPEDTIAGQWGDRLYIVYADMRTDVVGQDAWAGIGWVQDTETKKGLFVEHEGHSETKVRQDIHASLTAMIPTRDANFGEIQSKLIGITCKKDPVCALAVAVYQSEGWETKNAKQ